MEAQTGSFGVFLCFGFHIYKHVSVAIIALKTASISSPYSIIINATFCTQYIPFILVYFTLLQPIPRQMRRDFTITKIIWRILLISVVDNCALNSWCVQQESNLNIYIINKCCVLLLLLAVVSMSFEKRHNILFLFAFVCASKTKNKHIQNDIIMSVH